MAMGCGATCAKMALFIFNLIFWLSGVLLLGMGVTMLVSTVFENLELFLTQDKQILQMIGIAMIILGAFIIIVGFCGCCGAIRENRCLLGLFILLLFIIMGCEIAIGVFVVLKSSTVEKEMTENAKVVLNMYPPRNGSLTKFKGLIDDFQRNYNCCGIEGRQDWNGTKFYNSLSPADKGVGVPASCCPGSMNKKTFVYLNCATSVVQQGCKSAMMVLISNNLPIVMGIGFGVAALEIIGFALAICLCRNIGKEESETVY